jgi:hypothetical protein
MGFPLLALVLLACTVPPVVAEQQEETASPASLHRLMLTTKQPFMAAAKPSEVEGSHVSGNRAMVELCDHTYGFLPCTPTLLGNLFLLLVYGYFMYKSATMLSEGSELLLIVSDPGVVGGLLLPIVGVLPDTILVAGISTSESISKVM